MPDFPGEDVGGIIEAFDTRPQSDGEFYSDVGRPTRHVAPDFGAPQVWQISNLAVAQVLQRRLRRNRADLWIGTSPITPAGYSGSANSNGSGAIVAATAGSVVLPLFAGLDGFDISLSTVGTAAMTITVSNVVGGPFTYTIPTGGQTLSVRYGKPLANQGGTGITVAWSATAAAVGNVSVFGESFSFGASGAIYLSRFREPLQKLLAEGFSAVPVGSSVVILNQGGQNFAWRSQQELFAIANIAGPFALNVVDTLYGD